MKPSRDISGLIDIMAALRDREHGCPWDVEQTFSSIAPYTIFSAIDFLPLFITMLMKRATISLPCLGSGRMERVPGEPLRDMLQSW